MPRGARWREASRRHDDNISPGMMSGCLRSRSRAKGALAHFWMGAFRAGFAASTGAAATAAAASGRRVM